MYLLSIHHTAFCEAFRRALKQAVVSVCFRTYLCELRNDISAIDGGKTRGGVAPPPFPLPFDHICKVAGDVYPPAAHTHTHTCNLEKGRKGGSAPPPTTTTTTTPTGRPRHHVCARTHACGCVCAHTHARACERAHSLSHNDLCSQAPRA